jgi:hypothetical protein
MKKILIGISILLCVGMVIWFFFFQGNVEQNNTPTKSDTSSSIFPFGEGNIVKTKPQKPKTSDISEVNKTPDQEYLPILRKIWDKPVAGGVIFDDGKSTKIRFVERSTGHIYETEKYLPKTTRLSNTTIPRVGEALWQNDGSKVLLRYLRDDNETIRTFSGIVPTTTNSTIDGVFLADNIQSPALFKDKIAYITTSVDGATVITANMDGTKKTAIFTSPSNEWEISWTNPNSLALWSSPSIVSPGALYSLNTTKGTYNRVASEVYGGEGKLNKNGSLMLITGSKNSGLGTAVFDVKSGDKKVLDIGTVVDKCTWSPIATSTVYCAVPDTLTQGNYPDDWYQGLISTGDSVWRIDTITGSKERIFSPTKTELEDPIDVTHLTINNKGDTLLFMNKKDQTLWSYDIYAF